MNVLSQTQSLCSICKAVIKADVIEKDAKVFLSKRCEAHGVQETLLSSDVGWYRDALSFKPKCVKPAVINGLSGANCPYDCGLCASHQQKIYLPVVPVTSACNLRCPVCYTLNRNANPFHMSFTEFATLLKQMQEIDPDMQIINFTGGEPLMHPAFPQLVRMCHEAGIHRITVSTNGMRFLEDEKLLEELCGLDARIVLSWNSFESRPYIETAGEDLLEAKMRILELLGRYKPTTTLLTVVANGLNEKEIGSIVRYVMASDFIVSSEIHTITFTGQNERRMGHDLRITPPDIIGQIAKDNPWLNPSDFIPSPCAHPLCYSVCYALKFGAEQFIPLPRLMSRQRLHELLSGQLYLEPGPATEQIFREMIDELWLNEDAQPGNRAILKNLRGMMDTLFPAKPLEYRERQKQSERFVKAIYIHSHMDADNFDLERIRHCCVAVPSGDQRFIPTCSYNNHYRARDPRFSGQPGGETCATT